MGTDSTGLSRQQRGWRKPRRVYCRGLRSSHSVAMHYVLTLIGDRSILVDGIAGTGPDALAKAAPQTCC